MSTYFGGRFPGQSTTDLPVAIQDVVQWLEVNNWRPCTLEDVIQDGQAAARRAKNWPVRTPDTPKNKPAETTEPAA